MNKPKSVVVLSGGQDSVTTLFEAQQQSEVLSAIHFYYGQRHAIEEVCALNAARVAKVPFLRLELPTLQAVADSALTNSHEDIGASHGTHKHLPASFVPGRNLVFLTFAAAYAMKIGATQVWTGVCQMDYSGYPDCREDTLRVLESALQLGMEFRNLEIKTPLMHLTKAETFARAQELGVLELILNHTHTCYEGDHETRHQWGFGCGACPACAVRAKGWAEFSKGQLMDKSMDKPEKLPRVGSLPRPQSVSGAADTLKNERFDAPDVQRCVFVGDEFTSVCPRTGQPDFGRIEIAYEPFQWCLESKSLKFYLWAYRDEGAFCEALASRIADDIFAAIEPLSLEVRVEQFVRGGLALKVTARRGDSAREKPCV